MQLENYKRNLPTKLEDLARFVLIGREKLQAVKAGIRAIEKLDLAKEVMDQKKNEAQDLAGALLDAEVRIGQLFKALPKAEAGRPSKISTTGGTNKTTKKATIEKLGFGKTQAERFETLAEHPEIVEQVKAEAIENDDLPTRTEVLNRVRTVQKAAEVEEIRQKPAASTNGIYDVIVIDPPWPMQKIERDCAPNQVKSLDYPTMTEDELRGFKLPMADDCHVWLWTTHKFLPMAFRLLEHWELKYVCCFTWHKNGGFQPFGLPQYNSEFALYARRGTPVFVDVKAFNTCFQAPRGRHSEKPEEFYDIVRRVTGGSRIDIFSRRKIDGFDQYGNQI